MVSASEPTRNDGSDSEDFSLVEAWRTSSEALRQIASDLRVRAFVRTSPVLARVFQAAASRFVAGHNLEEALNRSLELYDQGTLVSIDFMGEDCTDPDEIERATQEFIELVETSSRAQVGSSVSVNLSHIGLALDKSLAVSNCERILSAARAVDLEVILNMEGDSYRMDILETYWTFAPRYSNLGVTVQACLGDTSEHLERCLAFPGRVRLVKGAYDELGGSKIRGESVDERFSRLAERLLSTGQRCSIATHDWALLRRAAELMAAGSSNDAEFEMLYGVATRRASLLSQQGFTVRVYLPYGDEHFLYLCHRLAEYPPNVHFAIKSVLAEFERVASHVRTDPH